ncbi:hypothetical protein HDU91_001750, partial [Kappamyces sp. JEL0680]
MLDHPTLNSFDAGFPSIPASQSFPIQNTRWDSIKWGIYKPESKNLGIIYLSAFAPTSSEATAATLLIASILENQMANVTAVLIDVRNNGGGYVDLADFLPQLFAVNINITRSRALMHPFNGQIFLNSTGFVSQNWTDGYRNSDPAKPYSNLVRFTSNQAANQIGQAFTKPIGVFHNANCYSACDMFAANMQDNAAATIFSEDLTSGAGGANVQEYSSFFTLADPLDFPPMPYSTYTLARQDARIGWRQTLRVGPKYDGVLIEDLGVVADYTFRPSVADVLPGATSSSQYDAIADVLSLEWSTSDFLVQPVQQPPPSVMIGSPLTFVFELMGVKEVQAFDSQGLALGSPIVIPDTSL